jgi:homeobox protein 6
MKEKINIIKRKNILILLFLNIIIISLILSMITKIEVKQINIGMVKKELNTNVDIEKIWDSSRLIKQNIKNNNDNNNNNVNNNGNNKRSRKPKKFG